MREIQASQITDVVEKLCIEANEHLPEDVKCAIKNCRACEDWEIAQGVLDKIIENYEIADTQCVPICQDTGMACVFLEIGQDVHITGGDLADAINEGVRRGYDKGYLRKSVVKDPVRRGNTGDNTPAMIYTEIVPGETTGGLDSVAVRFPSDLIAQELIKAAGGFVAAPSANTSGRPSPTRAEHVEEDLGDAIDMILDGGQVGIGLESTIVDFTEDIPVVLRPGYISLEMLQEILGEVRMDRGLLITDSSVHPKAPGMKYRHYAPKADLAVVEGNTEQVTAYINRMTEEAVSQGGRVGIIATDETSALYKNGVVRSIGSREDEETIAHHLYEVLRDFDGDGVSAIYSEAFYTPRMGQAIMNRLLKAAGHKIINVQEEQE